MKSLDAIDDLIVFLCIEAKEALGKDTTSISLSIKSLCESLALLGVGRCFVKEMPIDQKGKFKE